MSEVLIALAGNQNCGKTTLFNRYSGEVINMLVTSPE